MKILAIGDLVGEAGLKKLSEEIKKIKEENEIDFTIVNGENVADGMGIIKKQFDEMIKLGVDVVTMGNHTWGKRDIFSFIDNPKLIRPANYPNGVVGKGYNIYKCKDKKIAVINLIRKNGYECTYRESISYSKKGYKISKRKRSRYNNCRLSCRSNSRKNSYGVLPRWRNNSALRNSYTCSNGR